MAVLKHALLLWGAAVLLAGLAAAAEISRANQIKAAFLYNFPQFVDWPRDVFPDDRTPLVIGVLGDDPFDGFLDHLVQESFVNRHPLQVRRFTRWEDAAGCQVLFVAAGRPEAMRACLKGLGGKPILTVGDAPGFLADGGMIRLIPENNKMRLRVNLQAARAAKLAISSKLLRRAEIADPGTP